MANVWDRRYGPHPEFSQAKVDAMTDRFVNSVKESLMSTRCKFICQSKREYQNWARNKPNLYEYEFAPVISGSDENKAFFEATPDGSLKVSVVRDGTFVVGKSYYIDLTLAD